MTDTAYFGGGCFWCTEAIFQELKGVQGVTSGYAGGRIEHPSYEAVVGGSTGHAEVIRVKFDPAVISYNDLLEVFFVAHDPTTMNRQGNDVGEQYRSVILYATSDQKQQAEEHMQRLEREGAFRGKIVTQIIPFEAFYPAEAYHQNYYRQNTEQPYCQVVISPKLTKVRQKFSPLLKA